MGVVDLHMSTALNDLINAKVVDNNMLSEVVRSLGLGDPAMEMPIWEVVLFLVLSAITYYRKELSSNRVHREPKMAGGSPGRHNNKHQYPPFSPSHPHPLNNNNHLHHHHAVAGEFHLLESLLIHSEHMDPLALAGELKHRAEELKHRAEELIDPLKSLPTRLMPLLHHTLTKARGNTRQGPTQAQHCEPNVFTLCPGDVSRHIIQYLQPQEVLTLSQASSGLNEICHQNIVWRSLWLERFGDMWDSAPFQAILAQRHLHLKACEVKADDWRRFYFEFEWGWVDWLLAGYNREDECLVGIHDSIYDLTDFLEMHPGSKETILLHAGSDATTYFEDVGHSVHARSMMADYLVMGPKPTIKKCVLASVGEELRAKKRTIELGALGGGLDGLTHKLLEPLKELATHLPNVAGLDPVEEDEEEEPPQEEVGSGVGLYCRKCRQPFTLAPYTCQPCPDGDHQGLCRGIYYVTARRWLSWWSCCGQVETVNMPTMR